MKKMILAVISILILLFSSVLIFHVFSEDSVEINQGDETKYTTDDVMDEIDDSLLNEDDDIEIGEMI